MNFLHFIKLSNNYKIFRVILILLISSNSIYAQYKEYAFGRVGNDCYFNYIYFAPNSVYNNPKRPFIFILGKPGETHLETFENDTLKNLTQFNNYMFVYIPSQGITSKTNLKSLTALSSLLTSNYSCGRENLFLQINDENITETDIIENGLTGIFKKIRYTEKPDTFAENNTDKNIFDDFKETVIKTDEKVNDDLGTYYIEIEKDESADDYNTIPQKTFFGPPQNFNFTFSGIIRDKTTGEALPSAIILVKGTKIGTSSNSDGYFTLLKVPTDTSTLVVRYIGYNLTEVFLTPQIPKTNYNIELVASSNLISSVTVFGNKTDVELISEEDVSVLKFTPKKLEQLPSVGEKDIMRSFQLMPGVSAANESSSGLYVRGGTPDQNLVLYDGFTVYYVDHLYGFFSAFNSNAIKDVQLYKGGFESKFGGRLSSVTEITGKDGNQKRFNVGGDISLLSMNVFAEIPVGDKFSSIVTFRKSYKGFIYNKIFDKFNTSETVTPQMVGPNMFMQEAEVTSYFYDLNGKFTYRPNDKDIISLSIFNGTDKLDNGVDMQMPSFGPSNSNFSMNSIDLTQYGNIGSSLKWSRKWNSKIYGNTILSYSNFYSTRNRSQERTSVNESDETTTTTMGFVEDNNLKDYSLKSDYEWDLFNFSQIEFGAFATYFDIKYTYTQNDTLDILDRKNESLLTGTYLQSKFNFVDDKFIIIPGFRASYFETTKKVYYEPRLSMSLKITDKLSLKCATGKYYQFVNRVIHEDVLSGSKDFWLLSDAKNIPVSSALHYIIGLSYETNNYLFSAESYYKKIENLTEYSLRINASPFGVDYNENFFDGYGYSKGIEFLAQKKSGSLNGWMSYTLGEAKNYFDAYSDAYFAASQDVTHEFKIVGLYQYKRFDFSATWIFATGRPYTAPSGAYTITLLDGTTQDFFTVTSKNELRLPDYHRGDISVTYKLLKGIKGEKKRLELGYISFSLFNFYNHKNVWYKQYTIEDSQIIETSINYMGITPNLTLSLKLR